VQQVPGLPNGSGGGIPTYNLGDPQYLVQGGAEGYAARLAYEERREMLEDKRFDKYMRNTMMVNMQKMMGAQTPMIGDPGMYGGMGAIKEDIDEAESHGRVLDMRLKKNLMQQMQVRQDIRRFEKSQDTGLLVAVLDASGALYDLQLAILNDLHNAVEDVGDTGDDEPTTGLVSKGLLTGAEKV
jgi:hypothetical protein